MSMISSTKFINQTAIDRSAAPDSIVLSAESAAKIWGGTATPSTAPENQETSHPGPASNAAEPDWSDSLQSLLEQPPSALPQRMMLGGLLFTAIVGAWSWFGTIEEVSFAQGQLEPQGDVYKLQSAVAGPIVDIFVKEGETVQQGQTIATLDHQLVEKEIQRLEQSLEAYQQKLQQTTQLIQQTQAELNTLQAIAAANIASRQSSIAQEMSVIQTSETVLQQLQTDRQAQTQRLARLNDLVKRGAFAEDQLFQVEQALRERDRTLTETRGSIERSHSTITQLQAELAETQAMAEKQALEAAKQLQQLNIEATGLASKIQETQTLLERSQTERNQALLLAPVSGVISALNVSNTGEVMQAGQTIAEIAPSTAPLVLSALLPSHEAGLVDVGMPVNVKFDAFPYQDYGMATGEVLSISPDAEMNETTGAAYRVKIGLDDLDMEHEGKIISLRAGQTASAEIVVQQRRIISLVLDPIRKLQKGNISL